MSAGVWTLGQRVVVARSRGRASVDRLGEATIIKLGRKWATLDDDYGRFDIDTGALDGAGYSSSGSVWASRAEYDAAVALSDGWHALSRDLYGFTFRQPPAHMTPEIIAQVRALLFPTAVA